MSVPSGKVVVRWTRCVAEIAKVRIHKSPVRAQSMPNVLSVTKGTSF